MFHLKFHEKLQQLRGESGMSQEMLADRLDVSRQAVSKWESGQTYPEIDKLIRLSEIYGVSLDALVKDGELQGSTENVQASQYLIFFPSYEYKSKCTLFGLPLVHVNFGRGRRRAKGIIALGNIARGVVSAGFVSAGVLSIGIVSAGIIGIGALGVGALLAGGTISIGTFSFGAVSLGIFSWGAVSIGMFSTGALAIASHIAVGDHAYGHIAIGQSLAEGVRIFVSTPPGIGFSSISAVEVREAILEEFPRLPGWIVRLMARGS